MSDSKGNAYAYNGSLSCDIHLNENARTYTDRPANNSRGRLIEYRYGSVYDVDSNGWNNQSLISKNLHIAFR